ncbi:exonuclease SbcC [Pseudomonas duriflava]|uniref:Nuclease SbcCD subunit C n=1 Tax=Pseudomonas duriflava TaxID=459528 RepID=A0A562QCX3_9PSED|nr:AAA family ATPase [Pseudomonas duriflava]TWI53876.1 exonuclease SbcC [Pseudomonas duriflava]
MKILAIRLKNLASLAGPHEIDFTTEPLSSTGLFAITGPTGSGKSTLLDALSLGLFGEVPRLSQVRKEAKVPDGDGEIATGDPRTLLRRGSGAGYAEVDFLGIDGHRYRARWEANRARDRADGKLQPSRQSLRNLDTQQVLAADKKAEFKAQLELRLGLTFEQFTRAVLLAQSEFSAFLKADDNGRSELLEKLTDTAIYSQLGRRAFERAKQSRQVLDQLEQQVDGIRPLDDEARTALETQCNEVQATLHHLQAELGEVERQRQWLADLSRLEQECAEAHAERLAAQQRSDAQAETRALLHWLEQLLPQRHRYRQQAQWEQEEEQLAEQLKTLTQRKQALDIQLTELAATRQQAQAAREAAEIAQQQASEPLRQAFQEESDLARLRSDVQETRQTWRQEALFQQEVRTRIEALTEQETQRRQALDQITAQLQQSEPLATLCHSWAGYRPRLQQALALHERLAAAHLRIPHLQISLKAAQDEVTTHQSAIQALQQGIGMEGNLNDQIQDLTQRQQISLALLSSLERLFYLWQQGEELEGYWAGNQEKQTALLQERTHTIAEGKRVAAQHAEAEQALKITLELLERQRLLRSVSVEKLRAQLVEGEPCPVCGSQEHPYHQETALAQAMATHDAQEEEQARQKVQRVYERLVGLRTAVAGLNERLKDLKLQEEQLTAQQLALHDQLRNHPEGRSLLAQPEEQRSLWLNAQLVELKQRIESENARLKHLLDHQRRVDALQAQWQKARERSQQAAWELEEQLKTIQQDEARAASEQDELAAVLPASWLEHWQHDPAQTLARLEQVIETRHQQLMQHQENEKALQTCVADLERERYQQQTRLQQHDKLANLLATLEEQLTASQLRLQQTLGEYSSAQAWQSQLNQIAEQTRQQEIKTSEAWNEAHLICSQLRHTLELKSDEKQKLNTKLEALRDELTAWRAAHSELDDALLARLLTYDDTAQNTLRQQLQALDRDLDQAHMLVGEREKRLAAHRTQHADSPKVELLEARRTELAQLNQSTQERHAELRGELAEDNRRRTQSAELLGAIESARAEYLRWARLDDLIGSADGHTFRKIAQGYNLDLLVHHANVQLRQLVRRYRLKRGGSALGLLVMDTEMGDELRSVHSLSGGETFLVSLALALGLASMASSNLKIESLFIDEGFGSLDPDSLQLAMDALDGLQAQGRKVAVISHVQEMHERIPVQVQVCKQGNGLSTLRIQGPTPRFID